MAIFKILTSIGSLHRLCCCETVFSSLFPFVWGCFVGASFFEWNTLQVGGED